MKALTVCQGWASLMFIDGAKTKDVENRNWGTSYRGDLLIHAGKSKKQIEESQAVCRVLGVQMPAELPLGAIIGVVNVVGCRRDSESMWAVDESFHWILKNPRRLNKPVECNGALGLWQPTPEVMRLVKANLPASDRLKP